ncbi:hypothetical protein ACFRFL_22955 [Streptomyces sp. NPDC056708]|uniref:hypothetical protein n=1 Tax=unclassified Streptomyces TaxID=2593676 RepID=UPI0036849F5E
MLSVRVWPRRTPGAARFTLPTDFVGTENNALAHGQLIPLAGHASRVGLLMTATYAPASGLTGTVTVAYADGTSSALPITVPDWGATTVPKGTVIAADGGKVNGSGRAQSTRTAKLYTIGVDVDPSRQLAPITLPSGPQYMGSKTAGTPCLRHRHGPPHRLNRAATR